MNNAKMEEIKKEFYDKFVEDIQDGFEGEYNERMSSYIYYASDVWQWIESKLKEKDQALENQREAILNIVVKEEFKDFQSGNGGVVRAGIYRRIRNRIFNLTPQKDESYKLNGDLMNAVKNIAKRYDYFQSPSESKEMWSEIGWKLFHELGFTKEQLREWILSRDKETKSS